MTDPIRVFVGYSGNDEDLEFASVLHFSIETQASRPIDLTWMRLSRDPSSFWFSDPQKKKGWRTDMWATPFSALRWGIPAVCGFEGKAIYCDIDMIWMADVAELWDQKIPEGYGMLAKPEAPCVTLYDCERMKRILPSIDLIKHTPGLYREIRDRIKPIAKRYAGNWNCLDMRRDAGGEYASVFDPDIKVLHFTEIPTQPHLRYAIRGWRGKVKNTGTRRCRCASIIERMRWICSTISCRKRSRPDTDLSDIATPRRLVIMGDED